MNPGEDVREFYRKQGEQRALLNAINTLVKEMEDISKKLTPENLNDLGLLRGLAQAALTLERMRSK
jgi:signal transduction histidine kinase